MDKRLDYGYKEADKRLAVLEERIRKEYKQAADEVEQKLNKYLKSYYRNDREMRLMLDSDLITEAQYIEWRQKQILITNKWKGMREELTQTYLNADKVAQQMILEHRIDVYALNFNYGTYEVEMLSHLNTGFTLYNREAVIRLMVDNPKLLPSLDDNSPTAKAIRKGKLKKWNEQQLQSEVTQKILQGKPMPEFAKSIALNMGAKNMVSAIRAARTLSTSAQNAGRLDSYFRAREHGIEMGKMWITLHDERVRKSHRALDGEIVALEDTFSNELMYPADPDGDPSEVYNCRCRLGRRLLSVNGTDMTDLMETDYEWGFDEWAEERL